MDTQPLPQLSVSPHPDSFFPCVFVVMFLMQITMNDWLLQYDLYDNDQSKYTQYVKEIMLILKNGSLHDWVFLWPLRFLHCYTYTTYKNYTEWLCLALDSFLTKLKIDTLRLSLDQKNLKPKHCILNQNRNSMNQSRTLTGRDYPTSSLRIHMSNQTAEPRRSRSGQVAGDFLFREIRD